MIHPGTPFQLSPHLHSLSWEEYKKLPLDQRLECFKKNGKLFNVLFAKQFEMHVLDHLYTLTNKIRMISKTHDGKKWLSGLLKSYKVMFYFRQPSTRTFLSFATAAQTLGLSLCDVRDTGISSEIKGESFEDTVRTFSSYFDLIIMRDPRERFVEKASFILNKTRRPISIINAGSGKDEHPTQALLDIFTLRRSFEKLGGMNGKTILFVGDLKRGRTVRSLSYLLTHFPGVRLLFIAPKPYSIEQDVKDILVQKGIHFSESEDFKKAIPKADAIYMTRLQSEHDRETTTAYDQEKYSFTYADLSHLKPTAFLLHPLPRRSEIDLRVDADPRAIYWRQVRNGMWTRAALIAYLFGVDTFIFDR